MRRPSHPIRAFQTRMRRDKAQTKDVGSSPLDIHVPQNAAPTSCTFHRYSGDRYETLSGGPPERSEGDLLWIDVNGLADRDRIQSLCATLGISPLSVADIFHTDQRPHCEISEDIVQIVLRMPVGGPPFEADQITLFLGDGFVLSICERDRDCLGPVRRRLEKGPKLIRGSSGYLFYALIDVVIDTYFPLLERYGDATEILEDSILDDPRDMGIREIHKLKRELLDLRHALWPLREAVGALLRDGTPHIDDALIPFLRDCGDHAFQLLDTVEGYRDVAQGLIDLHLSALSNRLNEIMKVLTMIATLFIPLTFITGLYGMNFDRASPWNLPELGWRFGYEYALGLMSLAAGTMLFVFWRLGWIFSDRTRGRDKADNRRDR